MKLKFGAYKGKKLAEVPTEYLDWVLEEMEPTVPAIKTELLLRQFAENATAAWLQKVVEAGSAALREALEHNPDAIEGIDAAEQKLLSFVDTQK